MIKRKPPKLAMVQPPVWGNLRTPWEIAYVKSFLESRGLAEVILVDLSPATLPLVERFAEEILGQVDHSFETETFLTSVGFLASIAETWLIRLFYPEGSTAFRQALDALLADETTLRGDRLEALARMFRTSSFFEEMERHLREVARRLAEADLDYVGCTSHITSYPIALFLLKSIKQTDPHIRTVLSGYQATMLANETLRACSWVDWIICGESEGGYEQLFSAPGAEGRIVDRRSVPLDLNEMPAPDYRGLNMDNYKMVSLLASRNCPHGRCAFCQEGVFWSAWRSRRPDLLAEDMEVQHQRHGVTRFDFVDLDMPDPEGLCRTLERRGLTFRWSGALRADKSAPDTLRRMMPHRCQSLFVGFESGSSRLLHLMRKNITLETLKETLQAAAEAGIRVKLTCMTGLATETEEDFRATLDFVERHVAQIRLVLVQCFRVLTRSPIGMAIQNPTNPYGLRPIRIEALERVQNLRYALAYAGEPSPEVALRRFVTARRVFRDLGVGERALLLSGGEKHKQPLLGVR